MQSNSEMQLNHLSIECNVRAPLSADWRENLIERASPWEFDGEIENLIIFISIVQQAISTNGPGVHL